MMIDFRELSIRKVAWFYGGFFCFTLALMITFMLILHEQDFFETSKDEQKKLALSYQKIYQESGMSGLNDIMQLNASAGLSETLYLITTTQGIKVAGNINLADFIPTHKFSIDFLVNSSPDNEQGTLYIIAQKVMLSDSLQLLLGQDVTARYLKFSYVSGLRWIVFLALILGAVGGFYSGYFILHRLEIINHTSRKIIDTGDLSKRIPTNGAGKEFNVLAFNLNEMLDQIEELMSSIRQVSDNIAHDLRTPLTRLRHQLDQLESQQVTTEERLGIVANLKSEADHLLNIFSALLRISNIESGGSRSQFKTIAIEEMLNDLVELYEPIASEKQQEIRLTTVHKVLTIDGDLLFQALANIVDNAVKYTPIGGMIKLSMHNESDHLAIHIADNGIGVDEIEIPKLTRRFYRVEHSRNLPGNGLGLSLVSAVIDMNKGKLSLENNFPGLKVIIQLPY